MLSTADTIVALATPPGESALAIVRLSGPDCARLAAEALGLPSPTPRLATFARYTAHDGSLLDELVATYFADGKSFTGESMLELSLHGNPYIAQCVIEDLIHRGARSAEPGEFSRRAFLNGKIDLTQAEAIAEMIRARSDRALQAAQQQLSGNVGRRVNELLDRLLGTIAHLEAYIDFPDEDLPPEDQEGPRKELKALQTDIETLLTTQHYKRLLHDGIRAIIVGEPNAGKSSLLNQLVGDERVIVSDEPGTTRDYVEDTILVGPYPLRVVDTAGIRSEAQGVEQSGIAKTLEQAESADLVLIVLDHTHPTPAFPEGFLGNLDPARVIVVENKSDLSSEAAHADFFPESTHVRLSALTGEGLGDLYSAMRTAVEQGVRVPSPDSVLVSARHAEALNETKACLQAALTKLNDDEFPELIANDLRSALAAMEQIVGRVDNERVLDQLFGAFCIGK